MNVLRLTDMIADDPDKVHKILTSIGYSGARYNSVNNSFRFAREEGRNQTACVLDCKTLYYTCFSTAEHGTIYSLVMIRKKISFVQALDYVCRILDFNRNEFSEDVVLPFGGFWRDIKREIESPESTMKTYPETILNDYLSASNKRFIADGITAKTQEKFNVGYDIETNRIAIPEYSFDGQLVGVMGRSNDNNCPHEARWLPLIPAQRSLTLYGYHVNYQNIVNKKLVVLFESEKAVQQADSFGSNVCLATCGCHVSETQAKYIKSLMPSRVVVAFDEGLKEDDVAAECAKLVMNNQLLNIRVGYVWDSENEIIPAGSKANLADLGRHAYAAGLKSKVKYLN